MPFSNIDFSGFSPYEQMVTIAGLSSGVLKTAQMLTPHRIGRDSTYRI
jgi:hypothetical protein